MSENRENSLARLLQRKRSQLRSNLTKVTNLDGTVNIFDHGNCIPTDKLITGSGFVVDTKPDLSVGKITPWLYVSSQDVPSDAKLLEELDVTHVLSLLPGFHLPENGPSYKFLYLEFYDDECFVLDNRTLKPALDFITEAKAGGGRVLVHCNAGISRAPTVAAFYLMVQEGWSFDAAWKAVELARPNAKPNTGFWKQMKSLSHSLSLN